MLERVFVDVGAGGGHQVDGVRTPRPWGRPAARKADCVAVDSSGTSSPAAMQASAARMPGPPPLLDDGHAAAARKRLVHEQAGGVEQLLEGVDPHDTGLPEQLVNGDVGVGHRRRVRGGGPCAGGWSARS